MHREAAERPKGRDQFHPVCHARRLRVYRLKEVFVAQLAERAAHLLIHKAVGPVQSSDTTGHSPRHTEVLRAKGHLIAKV